jgi:hypothetical protein
MKPTSAKFFLLAAFTATLFSQTVFGTLSFGDNSPVAAKPETICKNTELYLKTNFEVVATFTPLENKSYEVTVYKTKVGLPRGMSRGVSTPLITPLNVDKIQHGVLRQYKGENFYLRLNLEAFVRTKTHHGRLEIPIDGKKIKLDVTCIDQ